RFRAPPTNGQRTGIGRRYLAGGRNRSPSASRNCSDSTWTWITASAAAASRCSAASWRIQTTWPEPAAPALGCGSPIRRQDMTEGRASESWRHDLDLKLLEAL